MSSRLSYSRSLVTRQWLITLLFALSIGILLGGWELSHAWDYTRDDLQRRVRQDLALAQASATEAAYQVNNELARHVVEGLSATEDIAHATLRDNFGTLLAETYYPPAAFATPINNTAQYFGLRLLSGIEQHTLPLLFREAGRQTALDVGVLTVTLRPDYVGQRFMDYALTRVWSTVGWSVVLSALLSVMFYLLLLRPLTALTQGVATVDPTAPGRYRLQVPERHAHTELGQLSDSINQLLQSLQTVLGERDEAKAALEANNQALEQRVRERTQALQHAMQELEAKTAAAEAGSRAKSTFLATMSHELRTPLNGVLGMAHLLSLSDLPEDEQSYVATITESGQTLLKIINEILELSNLETGQVRVKTTDFSPHALVDHVISRQYTAAQDKGLAVNIQIDPQTPPRLYGDAGLLEQVLRHLLDNAVKFTRAGEIGLHITPSPREQHWRFTVSDSGCGIAPEALGDILRPFAQADGSNTRAYGGCGLGLSIVTRLLELVGSQLDIQSVQQQGSRFSFDVLLPEAA